MVLRSVHAPALMGATSGLLVTRPEFISRMVPSGIIRRQTMALISGNRLGPYKILAPLGAGGMGEVYRARDTRLGRDVALKILLEAVAHDAERMARFKREAQVLASINHPNIATIHGLEDSSGTPALVMELVEGPTLGDRIAEGPMPLEEALPIAKQIAEGLESAHEKGIIHRDLKPSNVKVRRDGTVKILDFGLAKALDENPEGGNISNSPTISAAASHAGIILGTAAYMSPEQARGKVVDRRSDIWSFGAMLFEMLSGKQAFPGEDVSHTLAAVIMKDPDWEGLPGQLPAPIVRLLRRCLTKDPKQRLQAIGEARIAMEKTLSGVDDAPPLSSLLSAEGLREALDGRTWRRALPWALAAAFLAAAIITTTAYLRFANKPAERTISQINPPENTSFLFTLNVGGPPVISPNGRRLAFVASGQNRTAIWVQQLDQTTAQELPGTVGASYPFWSPDSQFLGFFAERKLKKIDVSGGPPVSLCDAPNPRGGAWNRDGVIIFAPNSSGPLYAVSAAGGDTRPATQVNPAQPAINHRFPQFLPDGRHFLFFSWKGDEPSATYVTSLDGESPKLLVRGTSNAVFAAPGYLLFVREGTLMAQRFNPASRDLSGDPMPVAKSANVMASAIGSAVSASSNGILAYQTGPFGGVFELVWLDPSGKQLSAVGEPAGYLGPRISRDGKKLAVTLIDWSASKSDIWILDLARGSMTRLTFSPGYAGAPVWSPDGRQVAFGAFPRGGVQHIYRKAADGTGGTEPLLETPYNMETPYSWSSDGKYLAYRRASAETKGPEIWALPLFGDRKPFPVVQNGFSSNYPAFSPNVKWLAYTSYESGREEVYAAPFPHGSGKWMVSTQGGMQPLWRHDGKEIFYVSPDNKLMAADVKETGTGLEIGTPHMLFRAQMSPLDGYRYDVGSDGKKFIVALSPEQVASQPITLVVNWAAELGQK